MTDPIPAAHDIALLQDEYVRRWHQGEVRHDRSGFAELLLDQHAANFTLWHLEDEARRTDVDEAFIGGVKRQIDRWNQTRNDRIERLDEGLIARWPWVADDKLPPHTETLGMVVDRLSVLSLRLFHMAEEASRPTADAAHRERCGEKVATLTRQRERLVRGAQLFLDELREHKRALFVFRQQKMYNDPALNPAVYGRGQPR